MSVSATTTEPVTNTVDVSGQETDANAVDNTAAVTTYVICSTCPDPAYGGIDQSYNPAGESHETRLIHRGKESLLQEFTPSQAVLVGVDVLIGSMNPGLGPNTLTVNIGKASDPLQVLATQSQIVASDFGGWAHFSFPEPPRLIPGERYVLELRATTATHGWKTAGDGYPGGELFVIGRVGETYVKKSFPRLDRCLVSDVPSHPIASDRTQRPLGLGRLRSRGI